MEIISLLLYDMYNTDIFFPTKAAQKYLVNTYTSFQIYGCFYDLQLVVVQ